MCAREHKYQGLQITHLLVSENSNTTYLSAREPCCGKIYIFLISNTDNSVYARNGRLDSWEEIDGRDAATIRALARKTQYNGLAPVYATNAAFSY